MTVTVPGTGAPPADTRPPARRSLTVLHVVAPAPFGGLETVLRTLASGLDRRGHEMHVAAVVTPGSTPHPFIETLRDDGTRVHELVLSTRAYREERRRIADLCLDVGADVIHTHGYRPDVIDSGVAARLGIPRVSTVHGFCGGGWKGRLYERLQIHSYRRFDAVIAVASPQVRQLTDSGVDAGRVHLLPNAWAPGPRLDRATARQTLGVDSDTFHIGWVGRLSAEKGPDLFLRSLSALADVPYIASIVGTGREEAALRNLADDLGIADRILWHGSLPEAGRYFEAFDAFALSSRTEGTPMVLFEAMASHTPIVASAVGGVPNVITPAEGWLSEADDTSAFGKALKSIHDDPAAAAAKADLAARRLTNEFGADAWLERHEDLYRRLIASHVR